MLLGHLFLELLFLLRVVCPMICALKLFSVASEVGGISSIETAAFVNFEP
jgi:hypothetical protein